MCVCVGGCVHLFHLLHNREGDMLARSWGFVSKASTIFELALYDRVETHWTEGET